MSSENSKSILIYSKCSPEESGLSALAYLLDENLDVVGFHPSSKIDKKVKNYSTIYLFGNYWNKQLSKIQNKKVIIFERSVDENSNPLKFITKNFLPPKNRKTLAKHALVSSNKLLLDLTVKKFNGDPEAKWHPVFSGLQNKCLTCFEGYLNFLQKVDESYKFDNLVELGKHADIVNKNTAEKRAVNKTTVIKTNEGAKIAITNAPENLGRTHEALNKFHQPHVSVTHCVEYDEQGGYDKISVRSYSDIFNTGEFCRKNGGNGNKTAGGFAIKKRETVVNILFPDSKIL